MSQKILLIDTGNSRIKWAYCSAKKPLQPEALLQQGQATHTNFLNHWPQQLDPVNPPQKIIISNVAGETLAEQIINQMNLHYCIPIEFVTTTAAACGITNSYQQPKNLGIDRWLSMIAVWNQTQQAFCVVDCGTATTIDVVDNQGQHLGGLILPGLETMQQALLKNTAELQQNWSDIAQSDSQLLAQNTKQAIALGINHSHIALIEKIHRQYPQTALIITGGLADPLLKSGQLLNARHIPDLVLQGLRILALDE